MEGGGCRGFSGEQNTEKSKQIKRSYNITSDQQLQLEGFFERFPYPDETQRDQIAKDLGLEQEQIKHWFQEKMAKMAQPVELQGSTTTLQEACVLNQESNICGTVDPAFVPSHSKMEKERMLKVAKGAIAELNRLVRKNNHRPLWDDKSSNDGGHVLLREQYENMFPRFDDNKDPHTREESSKYHKVMKIGARHLVEILLDPEEWVRIFPTIVSKAETVKVLDIGSLDDRSGALQVVYEEMNYAPLVASRELLFLRYCKQIEVGAWAIAHVSIDSFEERAPNLFARRLPSGCIICQLPDETSMVTWVEHVEVMNVTMEEKPLIDDNIAYGAKRWLWALHRTCERLACTSFDNIPLLSPKKVRDMFHVRRRATTFSDRMVREFFRVASKVHNKGMRILDSKMRVSIRKNEIPHTVEVEGFIATLAVTVSLSVPQGNIFSFLIDSTKRFQWDFHCRGQPAKEVAHFATEGNRLSIFKTLNQQRNDNSTVMVIQDGYTDPLESYVVYAPMTEENMIKMMKNGKLMVPVLPSGFFISEDIISAPVDVDHEASSDKKSRGSLLTMTYQIFVGDSPTTISQDKKKTVTRTVLGTIQKIKAALAMNISD